ncbi:MAG: TetR/AcrR family transcriptional regulator, partial [Nocardia sp.]|nr:TetR/AcrR family transcriptional regulator [Nocardia sp.]
ADRHPAFTRWLAARTLTDLTDPVAWTLTCLLDGITTRLNLPTTP